MAYSYNSSTSVSPPTGQTVPGGTIQLTATVQSGCPPFEMCTPLTGTLVWDDGDVGGSFATPSCTFKLADNLSVGMCATLYSAPRVSGLVEVTASFSGNVAYSPSNANVTITIGLSTVSSTSTAGTTSISSSGAGLPLVEIVGVAGGALVLVLVVAYLFVSRRKSL